MINDISQPLIFLGTNSNIFKIYELAENIGYTVAGIIDDDYHGQGKFKDLPIIAKEQNIADLKDQYQFFCVTNWMPTNDSVTSRNRQKRRDYIDLLDRLELDVATLVSPLARVSKYSKLGKGVFIDDFAIVEPEIIIKDYVSMHPYSIVGHGSDIGRNSIIQRHCLITSSVTVENDVYFGLCSRVCRSEVTISSGTFIHPTLMLLRSTTKNEEVSLVGKDLRKVYQNVEIE